MNKLDDTITQKKKTFKCLVSKRMYESKLFTFNVASSDFVVVLFEFLFSCVFISPHHYTRSLEQNQNFYHVLWEVMM